MTDDHTGTLMGAATRLEELRASAELRLTGAEDDASVRLIENWRRRWASGIAETQALFRSVAPFQSDLVMWPPAIEEDTPRENALGLMRKAAIGCRELLLLADQLENIDRDAESPADGEALASGDGFVATQGIRYFRSSQRFEGAVEIRRLIAQAQRSIWVIDGYISEDTLVLANGAPAHVTRRFLILNHRQTLTISVRASWARWASFWGDGLSECRAVGRPPLPHSRYLFIDGARYHFDASLKDFGHSFTHRRLLEPDEVSLVDSEVMAAWTVAVPL